MAQFTVSWSEVGDNPKTYEHTYDSDVLTLSEAREIKKWTTLNPIQWISDMNEPDNMAAMVCLLRRRDGESELRFTDVDFNYQSFKVALDEDAEPDPPVADSD